MAMTEKPSGEELEQFEIARQYWSDEDLETAFSLTQELVEEYPETGINWVLYGVIYSDRGDLVSAEEQFKHATRLAPKLELASINLFHSLWDQGKKIEAIEEKIRFTKLRDSKAYRLLWEDFGVEFSRG